MLRPATAGLFLAAALLLASGAHLGAQDASIGFAAPLTISGQLLHTERGLAVDGDARTWQPAVRALAYPSMKLGDHWSFYSALQLEQKPYSYYDTYYPESEFEAKWTQAFLGYRLSGERHAVGFKVGKMVSAFGAFPLRYDDTANPLIDRPLGYGALLQMRPDALPCGTKDLPNLRYYEHYEGVMFYCGGSRAETYGMPAIDLYGIPAVEADLSIRQFDARFQLTNSSPANPQSLLSSSQHAQWTAGLGWTLWQGFRVGVSGMRGPFLDDVVRSRLPAGKTVRDYPANAIGADMQWARGRWSSSAEWFRARFPYPRLIVPPTVNSVYGEVKLILTPRLFGAFRGSWQLYNRVEDKNGRSPLPFEPDTQAYEFAIGYRPNRWQLLKTGYEWLHTTGGSEYDNNVFGVQFVTSLDVISKAFR
jgi:hypothetical protein